MVSFGATQNVLKMQIKKTKNNVSEIDRRKAARISTNIAIKLKDKDVDFVTETKNVSCIGAYCQIDTYLPLLTKLKITLLIPRSKNSKTAKPIICEGTVVRIERCPNGVEQNRYNIAIYFNQISKSDMKLIDNYVKNHATILQKSTPKT